MGVPQLIIILLYTLSLGINMAKHGEPREGNYNFVTALISTAIMLWLLIWGGFFK